MTITQKAAKGKWSLSVHSCIQWSNSFTKVHESEEAEKSRVRNFLNHFLSRPLQHQVPVDCREHGRFCTMSSWGDARWGRKGSRSTRERTPPGQPSSVPLWHWSLSQLKVLPLLAVLSVNIFLLTRQEWHLKLKQDNLVLQHALAKLMSKYVTSFDDICEMSWRHPSWPF